MDRPHLKKMKRIKIAEEYSDTPLGRYADDSDFNGERFREDFLRPALSGTETVTVDIDGAEGYGSSFLEEAFGGLVRKGYFSSADLHSRLRIDCADPDFILYRDLIWKYIDEAHPPKA